MRAGRDLLGERAEIDLHLKYLWTHENADRLTLSTGDPVKFAAVDSQRLRLGARYSQSLNEAKTFRGYAGLAWEHESDGEARAKIHGHRAAAPKLKGDTGIAELGITLAPLPARPFTLDIGLQGYAGKREGVTGSLRAHYYLF